MSHLFGYFQGYAKENLPNPFVSAKNDQNHRKTKRSPKDQLSRAHLEATQPRQKRQALGDISTRQDNTGYLPQPLKPSSGCQSSFDQPTENYNPHTNIHGRPSGAQQYQPNPHYPNAQYSHHAHPQHSHHQGIAHHSLPKTDSGDVSEVAVAHDSSRPNFSTHAMVQRTHLSSQPSIPVSNPPPALRVSASAGSMIRGSEQKPAKEDSFSTFSGEDNSDFNNSLNSLLDLSSDDEDENPVPSQHILPQHFVQMPTSKSQEDVSRRHENAQREPAATEAPAAQPPAAMNISTTKAPAPAPAKKSQPEDAYRFHEIYCAEYATDIYNYLRHQENEYRPDPEYMTKVQSDLTTNMRQILIDWLVEVAEEYDITLETLLLAKNYIDRYLSIKAIRKGRLQLLGITALLVASKYEELVPVQVDNLVFISDNTYTKNEVLNFESELLNTLEFNMAAITEKNFLRRYLQAAISTLASEKAVHRVVRLSQYLVERTMQEYAFVKYSSSILACSAICLAMFTLGEECWTPALEHYTAVNKLNPIFRLCISELLLLFQHSWRTRNEDSQLQSVNEKYQVIFFDEANTPPATPPPFCTTNTAFSKGKAELIRDYRVVV